MVGGARVVGGGGGGVRGGGGGGVAKSSSGDHKTRSDQRDHEVRETIPESEARVTHGSDKNVKEGIYEFTDTSGKQYCGQSCNIPIRLKQHVKSGKLDPGQSISTVEVLGGKTAREIAEHKRIRELTDNVPARFSEKVSNKVDPIGPAREYLLD